MAEKLDPKETLRQGFPKLNLMIDEVNNFQKQIDKIVVEGSVDPLTRQALVDDKGYEYNSLKERLDSEHNKVMTDLAQRATKDEVSLKADKSFVDLEISKKADEIEVVKKGYGTLNDFDEETRSVLQGLTPGQINAVLGKENVTPFNLSENIRNLIKQSAYKLGSCSLGSLNSADGTNASSNNRFRTNNLMSFKSGDIIYCDPSIQFMVLQYNANGTYVGLLSAFTSSYTFATDCIVKIAGKYSNDSIITDVKAITDKVYIVSADKFNYSNTDIESLVNNAVLPLNSANLFDMVECEVGSIKSDDGTNVNSTTRARTNEIMHLLSGDKIYCSSNYKFYLLEYSSNGIYIGILNSFGTSYTANAEKYVKVVMAYSNDATITDVSLLASQITCVSPSNFNFSNQKILKLINEKPVTAKKWAVVGDSITDKNVHTPNKYHYFVAKDLGINVLDFGKSGTGFKRTEGSNTAFYQRVGNIPSDTDIVTIFGGGNDCSQPYTMGNATDTGTTTLCGAINTTIDNILAAAPLCQIAIISPTPWAQYPTSNTTNKMKELTGKLEEIAKLRGVKFLDMYHTSGLRPWATEFNSHYFDNADGVHPNELGHKFVYPAFKQLVLSMLYKLS